MLRKTLTTSARLLKQYKKFNTFRDNYKEPALNAIGTLSVCGTVLGAGAGFFASAPLHEPSTVKLSTEEAIAGTMLFTLGGAIGGGLIVTVPGISILYPELGSLFILGALINKIDKSKTENNSLSFKK